MKGMQEALIQAGEPVQIHVDYMDARRYSGSEYRQKMETLLLNKLANQRFALVMLSDNDALDFFLSHRKRIAPEAPVIFCGINIFLETTISGQRRITGVAEELSLQETIDAALKLHFGTKEIFVIGRTALPADRANRDAFLPLLQSFRQSVKFTFWDDLSANELRKRLPSIQDGSLIFINGLTSDETGRQLLYDENTRLFRGSAKVPLYSLWDVYLGHGIVGGKLVSGYLQGKVAGELAVRGLRGEDPDKIPVIRKDTANRFMFDYRELSRFNLSASSVPVGSEIINSPPSTYMINKALIWIGGVSLLTLFGMIVFLGINIAARKKAEEALQDSEAKYSAMVQQAKEGVFIIQDNVLQFANQGLANILGYTLDEIKNIPYPDAVAPESRAMVVERVQGRIAGEEVPPVYEAKLLRKDGSTIDAELSAMVIQYRGRPADLEIVRDITERKRAEEALRESERRFSVFMEHLPAAVFIKDPSGRLLFANRYLQETFGWKEFLGKTTEELLPREISERMIADDRRVLTEGPMVTQERIIDIHGAEHFFDTYKFPIPAEGPSLLLAGIAVDMTKRIKAEKELADTKILLQSAFDQTPVPMVLVSAPDGVFLKVNRACVEILGVEDEGDPMEHSLMEFNQTWQDFDPEGKRVPRTELPLALALQGMTTKNREISVLRKDGERRWGIVNSAPIYNEAGEMIAAFAVFPDITQQKRAEEALRESEEKFRNLVETTSDWIWETDAKGDYSYASPRVRDLLGYEPDEVVGRKPFHFMPPEEAERLADEFARITAERRPFFNFENVNLRKDGNQVTLETSGMPRLGPQGIFLGYRGIDRDITERKRATAALRDSETRYSAVVQQAQDGVIILQNNVLQFVNRAMADILGYAPGEMENTSYINYVAPESRTMVVEQVQRRIAGEEVPPVYEAKLLRKDGTIIDAELSASIIQYQGKPADVGIIRDITERKRTEEALRQSEEKFRLIAENTADVISINDMTLRFTYVSPSIMRLRGFTVEEAMAQTFDQVMTPESLKIALAAFEEEMKLEASGAADPDRIRTLELEEYRKDGSIIWVEASLSFLRDRDHKPIAILATTRDITKRKQAEEELRMAQLVLETRVRERTAELVKINKELQNENIERKQAEGLLKTAKEAAEASSKAKSTFLANMSHELRTPLNVIIGFSELMAQGEAGELNETQKEYTSDVLESSRHLLSLINDILDLSKVEAGKLQLEVGEVFLQALLQNSFTMVKEKSMKHGIRLRMEIDGVPERIRGDERKLKQILYNLLSNAVKFTPDGGVVTLDACRLYFRDREWTRGDGGRASIPLAPESSGEWVRISVRDTGIGLKKEDLTRIFEPFEQADNSASRQYQGTGLGLALVRKFVELHGGKIWAESEGEGGGSQFHFLIPVRPGGQDDDSLFLPVGILGGRG
jgi:PAS domain S-box-containing protein